MRACVLVVSLLWPLSVLPSASPKAETQAIAKKATATQSKQLGFEERRVFADWQTRFKMTNADTKKLAREQSSAAAGLAAVGGNPALFVSLGGAAGEWAPDDAHVVANFGQLLALAKLTREASRVLAYARTLAPKSPIVITNLGNVLWELGKERDAERAWRDAVKLDDTYGPAHEGLLAMYLKRHDVPHGIEELFKASQFTFVPSLSNAAKQVQVSGSSAPVPPPPGVSTQSTQATQGQAQQQPGLPRLGPGDRLVIPDLPMWSDRKALLASLPGLQPMLEEIVANGLGGSLAFAERYYGGDKGGAADQGGEGEGAESAEGQEGEAPPPPVARGGEAPLPKGTPSHPLSQKALFELELMQMYLADQLKQALTPYKTKGERASKLMALGIQQAGASYTPKIQAATARGDYDQAKREMAACSKAVGVVADKYFADWREGTREAWTRSRQALELYWVYTDGILGRIYDQKSFDFAQDVRRATVNVSLLPLAVGITSQATGMAIADFACLAPGDSAPPVALPGAPLKIVVPQKEKPPCPIEKLPPIPLGLATFTVTCEHWEIEFGQGVVGRYRRQFKTHEVTIMVGVDISADNLPINLGARGMVGVSFDGNGQPTHLLGEAGVGLSGQAKGMSASAGVGGSMDIDLSGHVKIDAPTPSVGFGLDPDGPG